MRIALTYGGGGNQLYKKLTEYCDQDEETLLDVGRAMVQLAENV